MAHDRLLPLPELERKVGFKKTAIYAMIGRGEFPQGKILHGKRLWRETEIDAWIEAEWKKAS